MNCSKCGQQFEEDSSFCTSCGKSKPTDIFPKISFLKALELGYRRALDFKGRSRRSEFWWWMLFSEIIVPGLILSLSTGLILNLSTNPITAWAIRILALILLIPTISILTRRLHDINISGWFQVPIHILRLSLATINPVGFNPNALIFITTGIVIFIYFAAKDGDEGPNKYGDSPKFPKTKDINQNI